MSQFKTIISSLGVPSSNNLFSESVSLLGTGTSLDRGLIDTCIISGTKTAFFLYNTQTVQVNFDYIV